MILRRTALVVLGGVVVFAIVLAAIGDPPQCKHVQWVTSNVELMRVYCSPVICEALGAYEMALVVSKLGGKMTFIPIGHQEEKP